MHPNLEMELRKIKIGNLNQTKQKELRKLLKKEELLEFKETTLILNNRYKTLYPLFKISKKLIKKKKKKEAKKPATGPTKKRKRKLRGRDKMEPPELALETKIVRVKAKDAHSKDFGAGIDILCECLPEDERYPKEEYIEEMKGGEYSHVYLAKRGDEVVGIRMGTVYGSIAVTEITGVKREFRRQGISKELKTEMSRDLAHEGIEFSVSDVEEPDGDLSNSEGIMRNYIRPRYHNNVTRIKMIEMEGGEILTMVLPKPESARMSLGVARTDGRESISSKEVAKIALWYYTAYLSGSDPQDRAEKLADVLTVLGATGRKSMVELIRGCGKKPSTIEERILSMVPEKPYRLIEFPVYQPPKA